MQFIGQGRHGGFAVKMLQEKERINDDSWSYSYGLETNQNNLTLGPSRDDGNAHVGFEGGNVCVNERGLKLSWEMYNSPAVKVSKKVWRVGSRRRDGHRDQSVREEKRGRKGCGCVGRLLFIAWRCHCCRHVGPFVMRDMMTIMAIADFSD